MFQKNRKMMPQRAELKIGDTYSKYRNIKLDTP